MSAAAVAASTPVKAPTISTSNHDDQADLQYTSNRSISTPLQPTALLDRSAATASENRRPHSPRRASTSSHPPPSRPPALHPQRLPPTATCRTHCKEAQRTPTTASKPTRRQPLPQRQQQSASPDVQVCFAQKMRVDDHDQKALTQHSVRDLDAAFLTGMRSSSVQAGTRKHRDEQRCCPGREVDRRGPGGKTAWLGVKRGTKARPPAWGCFVDGAAGDI